MSRMGAPDAYYALCDERGPDGPEGEVGESKSLEELLNPRGKRALFQMEPAQEMARRLRKLAERHHIVYRVPEKAREHYAWTTECFCGQQDCPDAEILAGKL